MAKVRFSNLIIIVLLPGVSIYISKPLSVITVNTLFIVKPTVLIAFFNIIKETIFSKEISAFKIPVNSNASTKFLLIVILPSKVKVAMLTKEVSEVKSKLDSNIEIA